MFKKTSLVANTCLRATYSKCPAKLLLASRCRNLQAIKSRFISNCSPPKSSEVASFAVIPSNHSEKYPVVKNSRVELDDIKIRLKDEEFILNLTSLRDFCFCSKCMHSNSRQKLFTVRDFRKEYFSIAELKTYKSGEIAIRWVDNHESRYSIDLLRKIKRYFDGESVIGQSARFLDFPEDDFYKAPGELDTKTVTWNVDEIANNMATVDFSALIGDATNHIKNSIYNANRAVNNPGPEQLDVMYNLTKSLVAYGIAKVINVPGREQEILNVARSIAYERPTGYGTIFDVVVEPSDDINLAYSSLEFDLHTDLPYRESMPGVQLLHCITNSEDGGESYFSDGYTAARRLQQDYPKLFHVLTNFPTTFSVRDPYRNVKFRRQYPIVSLDFHGDIHEIHYSPFHLPPLGSIDDVKMFYLALDKFTQYLQSSEQKLITKMDPGDLYIFHNRRVLHGRSSYDPTKSKRFLQGCYMDWDEIRALYEKLHSRKAKSNDDEK